MAEVFSDRNPIRIQPGTPDTRTVSAQFERMRGDNAPEPTTEPPPAYDRAALAEDDDTSMATGDFTILIIEDDEAMRKLVERHISRLGFRTETFGTGADALAWLAEHPAHLILTDLQLPDMTGEQLIQAISRHPQPTAFMIMTGQGNERVAVEMMKRGARDYIVKDSAFLEVLSATLIRVAREIQSQERLQKALEETRRRNAETAALLESTRAVLEHETFEKTGQAILACGLELMGATGAWISTLLPDGASEVVAVVGPLGEIGSPKHPAYDAMIQQLCRRSAQSGEVLSENHLAGPDAGGGEGRNESDSDATHTSILIAPLQIMGETVGVLVLFNKAGGFNQHDVKMAAVLSQFASLGLHKSRTLASLATSHQRFRWLIETASDAIVSIDASGRIVYWNTASEELFQHGRSDIVGQPITQVLPDGIGESLSGGADATSGRTHETVGRRRDGTEFPIELSIASYELEGERFLTGIIRSIVERKQAERALRESHEELERRVQRRTAELMLTNESLRREIADRKRAEDLATRFGQILNESLNEIYFVDANTLRFLKVNQGALSNLGYSLEELQQFSVLDIQPGMSTEALEACVAPLRAGMEQRVQFTSLHRRKDGTTYPVEVHLQLSSLDSSPVFVAMVLDITRRKELEEQANRHQSELAHVSRLSTMGEMGSAIAHELNQPLCAILSYAQATLRMMRSDKPDEADVMDALEQTAAQAKRAGEIIRHLKDFSRKREPHRSSINVNDVITEAIHFIAAETRSAAASIELQFAAELPMVLGDTIEIEQVVVNLARNAVEAMADLPPEQRRLVIHTWSGDEESVEVAFRDNGPGLPPEDVGRVFDPFYSTKAEGMGIGLSISRTIIEAHGGRLWATLNDEQGTTFRISLPTKSKTERTA